jgi:nucleoside-diphosphate-sugar epimerase
MKNLFLTGKTGSIGRNINFAENLEIDLTHTYKQILLKVNELPKKSTLLHLAGITDYKMIEKDPQLSRQVNVSGSLSLFKAFEANGGKRFIFASTGHVYGNSVSKKVDLNSPTKPITEYAKQKLETETMLLNYAQQSSVELVILRIFSIFGPGMSKHYLASRVFDSISTQQYAHIKNSNDIRDFMDLSNLVKDIKKVVQLTRCHTILNICTGNEISIRSKILSIDPGWPLNLFEESNSALPYLAGIRDPILDSLKKSMD